MRRRDPILALALAALLAGIPGHPARAATPLSTAFTYQGSLDKSGLPGSASCAFTFKLFDALSTGTQIGSTLSPAVTILENGQFSTVLDFGIGMFDGNQRWLEITVQCPGDGAPVLLAPRQAITATPYALYALTGAGGGGGFALPYPGAVTSSAQDAFRIQNNATTGAFFAIHGVSATSATNAGGMLGEATAATGQVTGVFGKAVTSPNGIGVIGQGNVNGGFFEALSTTGDGSAVYGLAHTDANNAAGVKGVNNSPTGVTVGTWGVATASPTGTGVAGSGSATGGYFSTGSTNGAGDFAGVYGVANVHPGVKGVSNSGFGVRGEGWVAGVSAFARPGSGGIGLVANGNGAGPGVLTSSTSGAGVLSSSSSGNGVDASSGSGNGVYGSTATGRAIYGDANNFNAIAVFGTNPLGDGVWGQSNAVGKSGVVGVSYNASGVGGWFQNNAGGVALYANGLAQVKTLQILGADLAESFPVKEQGVEPGTVVMIDGGADGALRVCDEAYSHRVAGVVSGANGLDAAVVLKGRAFDSPGQAAVAMSGRVWVKCDASAGAIHPGDLLTTAARSGHAMRADDRGRAYGAILGKAMTPLEAGTGLVLVLVNLQ